MARYDKNMEASAARPLSVPQLLALLDRPASGGSERSGAVACFLAGAEGWQEAAEQLGGAFAEQRGLIDDQSQ